LDAIFKAEYPDDILKDLIHFMPKNLEDDMTLISSSIDWIGINYYTRTIVAEDANEPWPSLKEIKGSLQQTQMGWEIYPDGLKNCDQIMEYGIMLPCHPTMTDDDCAYVQQTLKDFIDADGNP